VDHYPRFFATSSRYWAYGDNLRYISVSHERILMKLFGGVERVARGPNFRIFAAIGFRIRGSSSGVMFRMRLAADLRAMTSWRTQWASTDCLDPQWPAVTS